MNDEHTVLRHMLATIAYRGGKVLRDAPEGFGAVSAGPGSRAAVQILAHMADLFAWALALSEGEHRWSDTDSDDWDAQIERFYAGLAAVDARLDSPEPLGRPALRLLQGPLRRLPHSRGPACAAEEAGQFTGPGRELLRGQDRGGTG